MRRCSDRGADNLAKMHSVLAVLRYADVPLAVAWAVHALMSVAVVVAVLWIRRTVRNGELTGAALALGAVMVTPYIFMYDLVVLAIPVVLLLRMMVRTGVRSYDVPLLLGILLMLLLAPLLQLPLGLAAMMLCAGWIGLRVRDA